MEQVLTSVLVAVSGVRDKALVELDIVGVCGNGIRQYAGSGACQLILIVISDLGACRLTGLTVYANDRPLHRGVIEINLLGFCRILLLDRISSADVLLTVGRGNRDIDALAVSDRAVELEGGVAGLNVDGRQVVDLDGTGGSVADINRNGRGSGSVSVEGLAVEGCTVELQRDRRSGVIGSLVIDDRNTGSADVTGDLAAGNGELVTGYLIGIGAVRHRAALVDRCGRSVQVDDYHTGCAALYKQVSAGSGNALGLTRESVLEVVDSDNGRIFPCVSSTGSAHQLIVLDEAGRIQLLVLRTNEEQCGSVGTRADRSPTDDLLFLAQRSRLLIAEGIVGLDPEDVVLLLGTAVAIVDKSGCVLGRERTANGITVSVVGDAHVLGVGSDVEFACVCKNLTVDERVGVLVFDRVGNCGPIIGTVGIIRRFDMLCSVETEAVNTVVYKRNKQVVDNIVLIILILGFDIGELTAHIVFGHRVTRSVGGRG